MTQPTFVFARSVVDGLVDAYLASPNFRERKPCTSFRPDDMRAALVACPSSKHGPEYVDVPVVNKVLDAFECFKLTAGCNRWTDWMRTRLRESRVRKEAA